jgi:hypothetical protein
MAQPLITGSFYTIQHTNIWNCQNWIDECRDWGDESWRALVRDMHGVGMDTIVNSQMALWSRPLFPDPEMKVGKSLKLGCEDPAIVVADEAGQLGMKVWYGLGLYGRCSEIADYRALTKPWPDLWFDWNIALAESLMDRYKDTPSFAGLYLTMELGADPARRHTFNEEHVEFYERWVKSLRPVVGNTRLLASPGILDPGDYSRLARQLERFDIDVIAYQDLGGRATATREDYERISRAGEALERLAPLHREAGVELWANCETFSRPEPRSWRPVCLPGDMERIKHQLAVCSPPVDKVITWIYQGVWNRRHDLVQIGPPESQELYDAYQSYREDINRTQLIHN